MTSCRIFHSSSVTPLPQKLGRFHTMASVSLGHSLENDNAQHFREAVEFLEDNTHGKTKILAKGPPQEIRKNWKQKKGPRVDLNEEYEYKYMTKFYFILMLGFQDPERQYFPLVSVTGSDVRALYVAGGVAVDGDVPVNGRIRGIGTILQGR